MEFSPKLRGRQVLNLTLVSGPKFAARGLFK